MVWPQKETFHPAKWIAQPQRLETTPSQVAIRYVLQGMWISMSFVSPSSFFSLSVPLAPPELGSHLLLILAFETSTWSTKGFKKPSRGPQSHESLQCVLVPMVALTPAFEVSHLLRAICYGYDPPRPAQTVTHCPCPSE